MSTLTIEVTHRIRPNSLPAAIVERRRLEEPIARLLQSAGDRGGPVVLVSAPAGAGKTVLLSAVARYLRGEPGQRSIVIRLEIAASDNNPAVLCRSLKAAFEREFRKGPPGRVPRIATHNGAERFSADLAAAVGSLGGHVVLAIDDAHVLHSPPAVAVLDQLLRCAPANLAIAVSARFDPPIAWHQLALEGRLTRLGAEALALDEDEIAQSLSAHGVRLTPPELTILAESTRGWCALVQLSALLLVSRPADHPAALAELAWTPQPLADYLVGEVLAAVPDATVRFMLRTSIVDRVTIDLADKLSGTCAEREIQALSRLNMPITRQVGADGLVWHSYHPLLREHLRAEFRRRLPAEVTPARVIAADWLRDHRIPLAAFDQELEVADTSRITATIRRCGLGLVLDGDGAQLTELFTRIPPSVNSTPPVRLLRVAVALAHQDIAAATTYLGAIDANAFAGDDWARTLWIALRLEAALLPSDEDSAALAVELRSIPLTGDYDLDAYSRVQLGSTAMASLDFEVAISALRDAIAFAEVNNRRHIVFRSLCRIAMTHNMAGDVALASTQADAALEYSHKHVLEDLPDAEHCWALRAMIGYACDAPSATQPHPPPSVAQPAAPGAAPPASGGHEAVIFSLYQHEYGVEAHRYDTAATVRNATAALIESQVFPSATLALLPMVVNICLDVGQPQWAAELVGAADRQWGDAQELSLCRAYIEFATGKVANARADLDAATRQPRDALMLNEVYALLLGACIEAKKGRAQQALELLRSALRIAEPAQVLRPFLDMRLHVWELLNKFTGLFREQEQFAAVVRSHLTPSHTAVASPLTPSERDVLEHIATGESTMGIAGEMCLSINTIKTHLSSIYRKLGVRNRREAVVLARQLGLI